MLELILSPSMVTFLKSPIVCNLCAVGAKLNPSMPSIRPDHRVWDIDQVLYYLGKLPDYPHLSLMQLSQKTLMLMLLVTSRRKVDVSRLSINNMVKTPAKYTFQITVAGKNYRPHFCACQMLVIERLGGRPEICPYTALSFYLHHTKFLRATKSLFIITTGPGTTTQIATLNRWATTVLKNAGIDTRKFTSHSTRSAASSKGYSKFLPLQEILQLGTWGSASTFFRHYCQQVDHFQPPQVHVHVQQAQFKKNTADKIRKKYFYGVRKTPAKEEVVSKPLPLTVENVQTFTKLIAEQRQAGQAAETVTDDYS